VLLCLFARHTHTRANVFALMALDNAQREQTNFNGSEVLKCSTSVLIENNFSERCAERSTNFYGTRFIGVKYCNKSTSDSFLMSHKNSNQTLKFTLVNA
jgi:hypothetical protein